MKTIIIASMDRNGVIGRTSKPCPTRCERTGGYRMYCGVCNGTGRVPANDVPWSYPEIDEHFDRMTMGHAVIMGRRTWEARGGRPLKGRTNVVVSRNHRAGWYGPEHAAQWVFRATSVADAKALTFDIDESSNAYIIGGASLFAAALPLADELDLTLIDHEFEGDVRMPGGDGLRLAKELHCGDPLNPTRFVRVDRRQGSTPELTFTRWVKR